MPTIIIQNQQQIDDFIRGATFYGTGGGGDPVLGKQILTSLLQQNIPFGWVDPAEIAAEDLTASVFGMGSTAPRTDEVCKEMRKFGLDPEQPRLSRLEYIRGAIDQLEEYSGKSIKALVPIELGGGNSVSAIAAAAVKGIAAIDGDYAGRAVPAMHQTTVFLKKRLSLPMAFCDCWGNRGVLLSAINGPMMERIGKFFSVAGFGPCGMAGHFMLGADMKDTAIPGTMTACLHAGRILREAREAKNDPVAAITEALGGWILCRGTLTNREWEDRDGYFWGYHTISGEGEYSGTQLRVMFQNENHICWENDDITVTSPDLIILIDDETGEPYTNTVIKKGMRLAVIGLKSNPVYRSPEALNILGPYHFGIDRNFIPIEQLI